MKSNLKCSNCGAEITNLNFGWDKKQWLWFIPFLLFLFIIPFAFEFVMKDRSDFRVDLSVNIADQKFSDDTVEIIGVIENNGKVEWEDIIVQAEFYSADERFLEEITRRVYTKLPSGASEYFQIQSKEFPEDRWEATERIEIKVSEARHSRK